MAINPTPSKCHSLDNAWSYIKPMPIASVAIIMNVRNLYICFNVFVVKKIKLVYSLINPFAVAE